jgi:hypothetical protein
MMLLLAILAGSWISTGADPCPPASAAITAGGCEDFLLLTSGTGAGLWLCRPGGSPILLSSLPGSGRNAFVREGAVYFREISRGSSAVSVWRDSGVSSLLEGPGLCGPFPAAEGVLSTEGGEIIFLGDEPGSSTRFETGADIIPSVCECGGSLWFVDGYGSLWRMASREGSPERAGFEGCATVSAHGDEILLRHIDGTFSVLDRDGRVILQGRAGLWPEWTTGGEVISCTSDGSIEMTESVSGETRVVDRGQAAFRPLDVPGWGICWTDPADGSLVPGDRGADRLRLPSDLPSACRSPAAPSAEIDVPWLHQRWDTPDWFDGSWSCGPSSCTMAVQYYDRLTPDSIWCSSPSPGHWSRWGSYIPSEFTFLGYTYDILGVSPGAVWVPGAHGFICRDAGGAYWAYMALYMQQIGLESGWAGTGWSTLTSELQNSWPVVCSSTIYYGSGTYGHIILFAGYYDDRTVIVNDPFGDANDSGWGGSLQYPEGKAVLYDWPGYNNGHLEIGAVNQLFTARHDIRVQPDTLVDDLSLGFEKLGPCEYWHEQLTGYSGSFWWTYTTASLADTNFARWHPVLPQAGYYEVSVFIPPDHAEGTAIYRLSTQSGPEVIALDQSQFSGEWASLGAFYLAPGDSLYLGDGNTVAGEQMAFDAALFSYSPGGMADGPGPAGGIAVFPNPCTGAIHVLLAGNGAGSEILLLDLSGRIREEVMVPPGACEALIGEGLPCGAYLIRSMPSGDTCKALVLR